MLSCVSQERDLLRHRVSELEQLKTTVVESENAQLRVDNAALLQQIEALVRKPPLEAAPPPAQGTALGNYE